MDSKSTIHPDYAFTNEDLPITDLRSILNRPIYWGSTSHLATKDGEIHQLFKDQYSRKIQWRPIKTIDDFMADLNINAEDVVPVEEVKVSQDKSVMDQMMEVRFKYLETNCVDPKFFELSPDVFEVFEAEVVKEGRALHHCRARIETNHSTLGVQYWFMGASVRESWIRRVSGIWCK